MVGFDTVGFGKICYCWFLVGSAFVGFQWGLIFPVLVWFDMDLLTYFGWYDDTLVWFFIVCLSTEQLMVWNVDQSRCYFQISEAHS